MKWDGSANHLAQVAELQFHSNNMLKYYRITLCISLLLMGFAEYIFAGPINFKLIDKDNGEPIQFACITANGFQTYSNLQGECIVDLPADSSITISHITYGKMIIPNNGNIPASFYWEKLSYDLGETSIIPPKKLNKILNSLRRKYLNYDDDAFGNKTFYYRQITDVDNMPTEYIESVIKAKTSERLTNFNVISGRSAKLDSLNGQLVLNLMNAYSLGSVKLFSKSNAPTKNKVTPLFCNNFLKIFDIKVDKIYFADTVDEMWVCEFYEKKYKSNNKRCYISGKISIKLKDLTIIASDIHIRNINMISPKNTKTSNAELTIKTNYKSDNSPYPIVDTEQIDIKFDAQNLDLEKRHYNVISYYTSIDTYTTSKGNKLGKIDNLFQILSSSTSDSLFLQQSLLIKRTEAEEKILNDFKSKGLLH
jgi:hypothetical protein